MGCSGSKTVEVKVSKKIDQAVPVVTSTPVTKQTPPKSVQVPASALSSTDQSNIQSVTYFWYGGEEQPGWDRNTKPVGGWNKKWFNGGEAVDKMISDKYRHLIEAIAADKLEHWK